MDLNKRWGVKKDYEWVLKANASGGYDLQIDPVPDHPYQNVRGYDPFNDEHRYRGYEPGYTPSTRAERYWDCDYEAERARVELEQMQRRAYIREAERLSQEDRRARTQKLSKRLTSTLAYTCILTCWTPFVWEWGWHYTLLTLTVLSYLIQSKNEQ